MRLGIMLRHFDQHEGGVKVYTREIVRSLIEQNRQHEIVLLFRNRQRLGTYRGVDGVQEVLLEGGPILLWDQIKVPRAVDKLGIDVLFNPKYSIPLRAKCKTSWVCHGLDWYAMPQASPLLDRMSHKYLVPRYVTKADALISVSAVTTDHLQKYLSVPRERIHTIYSGLSDGFRTRLSPEQLEQVRQRFSLPPRFLLYCGAIYPPKNFTRLIQAYAKVGPAQGMPLVIAGGGNRYLSAHELDEPKRQNIAEWVKWPGWIENKDLPAFYQLADGLLLPSLYESVGMPIMEAMSCGCPVLTSDRFGTKEIAGDAALLVDPESVDAIAAGIDQLLNDQELRTAKIAAGEARARQFTWTHTASELLRVLESL
ncbi:glycosyltransferase family 4 protein [Steroidobacter agaridevorans]|uniref:glycosyltransferase family 4 protein n=1 Tax=Steroidobacter agaridevorans TaxID=2695856 RepID=UPI0013222315|nr:glycosyltransferase family 1 protein [Steroidobacter agaridevorans]GFE86262.1 glycosyl transferase [Steroidobacter agaridevorans]